MMRAAETRDELEAAVRQVQAEASGILSVEVVTTEMLPDLMLASLGGDSRARELLQQVNQALSRIARAPKRRPMLCCCCPRRLKIGRFAIAIATPARDDPSQGLSMAVCQKCALSPDDVMAKAAEGLRRLFPDLRVLNVHPAAGRA